MEIRYTPTAKDLMAFQSYALRRPGQRRGRTRQLAGLAACVILGALALVFVEELWALNLVDTLLNIIFVLAGLLVVTFVWQKVFLRWVVRSLPGEVTVRIAEEGLHYDDGRTHAMTRWSGVEHIGQTRDHILVMLGYAQGYALPRTAFSDDDSQDDALRALRRHCPEQEIEPPAEVVGRAQRRKRRLAVAGGLAAALLLLLHTSPWRSSVDLPDDLGSLDYLITTTGGADPDAVLPLILDLHPLGGFPEIGIVNGRKWAFPARVVYPAAAQWHIVGQSWFDLDEDMTPDARAEAARLAAFTRILMARHPTAGRPIVTGFSQGGSMAFEMAALHPELFAAAVPVAGALPDELPDHSAPPSVRVRALHGADDAIVPSDWARSTVEHMAEHGWNAQLQIFPEVGHRVPEEVGKAWRDLLAELAAEQASQPQLGAR